MLGRPAWRLVAFLVLAAPRAWADDPAPDPSSPGYLQALADDERPLRKGFTFELGLGGGLTHVAREGTDAQTGFGPTTLSFGLGWFVGPKVALLGRTMGTTFFDQTSAGDTSQIVNQLYAAHVQYWVNDTISLSAGPALAVVFQNPILATDTSAAFGFGGSSRVGFSILSAKHHTLRISWETLNTKVARAFVFGGALSLEWQTF